MNTQDYIEILIYAMIYFIILRVQFKINRNNKYE